MKRWLTGLALILGIDGFALAVDNYPYVALQGGVNFGGSARTAGDSKHEIEEGASGAVLIHVPYESDTASEIFVTHTQSSVDLPGTPDIAVTHVHFGGIKYIEESVANPFVGASVGVAAVKLKPGDDVYKPAFSLYTGLQWQLNRHVLLRVDARWLGVFFDSTTTIYCGGNGCDLQFTSGVWSEIEVQAGLGFSF